MEWLFYVEGHPQAGMGHVGRAIGLAQACQQAKIPVFFLIRKGTPRARALLAANGIGVKRSAIVRTASDLERWLRRHHPAVMVVDGLTLTPKEKTILKDLHRTARLLQVDDLRKPFPFADAVVQPAEAPNRILRQEGHLRLLGPRFATLRREFLRRRAPVTRTQADRVLLTLGGSSRIGGKLREYARALEPLSEELTVLSGTKRRVASLMSRADVAVVAAGHSALELARLGIPLITIQTSPLQGAYARMLADSGAAIHAGHLSTVSGKKLAALASRLLQEAPKRRAMSRAGRRLVDGLGAARLIRSMSGPKPLAKPLWRPARPADARWLWQLRNAPRVRKAYLGTRPIPFGEHKAWLLRTLHDPDRYLYIILNPRGGRVGQIRLDRHEGGRAEIGISFIQEARGKGYGRKVLSTIMTYARKHYGLSTFIAHIKRWNKPSLRLFLSQGFRIVRRRPHYMLIQSLRPPAAEPPTPSA